MQLGLDTIGLHAVEAADMLQLFVQELAAVVYLFNQGSVVFQWWQGGHVRVWGNLMPLWLEGRSLARGEDAGSPRGMASAS